MSRCSYTGRGYAAENSPLDAPPAPGNGFAHGIPPSNGNGFKIANLRAAVNHQAKHHKYTTMQKAITASLKPLLGRKHASDDFWGALAAMLVALPAAIAFGVTIY